MHAMIESRWATGTYEMLIEAGTTTLEGEVGITLFATPLTLDPADDEDAPILAQIETPGWELGVDTDTPPEWAGKLREIGEHGLKPEDVVTEYGPLVGLRILTALYQAAEKDAWGTDIQGRPWRTPSPAAEDMMARALKLIIALT